MTWVRVILPNILSSSVEEWTEIFKKKENSGIYNKQFVILDLNKIVLKNKILPNKTLMIIEQITEYTEAHDVSYILNQNKYFGSYNVPFSQNIVEKSYNNISNESFSYWKCPRTKIFKKEQGKINSYENFKNY